MLNNRQIEIADILLKILSSENIVSDNYSDELQKLGYNEFEVKILIEILINSYNLAYYHIENLHVKTFYILTLTPEGNKAAKKGIKKYIQEIEYDKQLDRDAKVASIKTSKWAIGISFTSLLIAIVVPFLVEKCKNDVSTKTEPKNQVYESNSCDTGKNCNKYVEHTGFPNKLTDSSLVEKLKDSIKHDTKFLNELKLELKRNTTDNQAPNR